jgi:hypothetical protein
MVPYYSMIAYVPKHTIPYHTGSKKPGLSNFIFYFSTSQLQKGVELLHYFSHEVEGNSEKVELKHKIKIINVLVKRNCIIFKTKHMSPAVQY